MLTVKLTRGSTGRQTYFNKTNMREDEKLIIDWTILKKKKDYYIHPGATQLKKLISNLHVSKQRKIICFRGAKERHDMLPSPRPYHFGPPPMERTHANRYNESRKPALYLSTTPQGVALELKNHLKKTDNLLCQEYIINPKKLNLIDFCDTNLANFIHIVFDYAEQGLRTGTIDIEDYFFSQVVAQIVNQQGFSGMIVPGVRGNKEHQYKNVVIFNPGNSWMHWVNPKKEPFSINDLL